MTEGPRYCAGGARLSDEEPRARRAVVRRQQGLGSVRDDQALTGWDRRTGEAAAKRTSSSSLKKGERPLEGHVQHLRGLS